MNARAFPEVLLRREPASAEPELMLSTEGVLRYVWESRFGPMLIEVIEGEVFVDGEKVTPAQNPPGAHA